MWCLACVIAFFKRNNACQAPMLLVVEVFYAGTHENAPQSYSKHQDASQHDRRVDEEGEEHSVSADDMIERICEDLPKWAVFFRGLHYREDLTQAEMGEKLGIAQTNISQMELGKRAIGKKLAMKLAKLFNTDHIFL